MKKYLIFTFLTLAITIANCTGDSDCNYIYLDYQESILNGKQLKCKKVNLPFEEIYAEKYWMISDTMLVIEKRREGGNFIDIVNPVDGHKYSSLLPYGEGPDDMIFCAIYFDGKFITAVDYIRSRYAKFTPIEASCADFRPHYVDYPREIGVTSSPIGVGDSTFLINPFCYINRSYDVIQDLPRFIVFENDKSNMVSFETGEFHTHNVGQMKPLADENNCRIWLFSTENSKIDIYDYHQTRIKGIRINDELDKDAEIVIDDGAVLYNGKYPRAFLNPVIDYENAEILVPYVGKIFKSGSDDGKCPSKILVFDLEGNFKRAYLSDMYVPQISVTSKGLYATAYDEDDMPILVEFENMQN